jgi:hypothetical protein
MAGPELTLAWWDKNKAKTLPPTNLGKALQTYEKALKGFAATVSRPGSTSLDNDFKILETAQDEVSKMIKATSLKCNKSLHKETIDNLNKMLSKLQGEIGDHKKAYAQAKTVAAQKFMGVRENAIKQLETKNLVKRLDPLSSGYTALDREWQAVQKIMKKPDPTPAEVKAVYAYVKSHKEFTETYRKFLEDADAVANLPYPQVDIIGLPSKATLIVKTQDGKYVPGMKQVKNGRKALLAQIGDLRFFKERIVGGPMTSWQKAHPGSA